MAKESFIPHSSFLRRLKYAVGAKYFVESVAVEAIQMLKGDYSLDTLLEAYRMLSRLEKPSRFAEKLKAEVCFLIAREYNRKRSRAKATHFANEAMVIYNRLKIDTLDAAVPILDWLLPEYMHEGVVKSLVQ